MWHLDSMAFLKYLMWMNRHQRIQTASIATWPLKGKRNRFRNAYLSTMVQSGKECSYAWKRLKCTIAKNWKKKDSKRWSISLQRLMIKSQRAWSQLKLTLQSRKCPKDRWRESSSLTPPTCLLSRLLQEKDGLDCEMGGLYLNLKFASLHRADKHL